MISGLRFGLLRRCVAGTTEVDVKVDLVDLGASEVRDVMPRRTRGRVRLLLLGLALLGAYLRGERQRLVSDVLARQDNPAVVGARLHGRSVLIHSLH